MGFLSFSSESNPPVGEMAIRLFHPLAKEFNKQFCSKTYCDDLDEIFIVFVSFSEEWKEKNEFYKERKYVSKKNRYADMRLYLEYEQFLKATQNERINMLWNIVQKAIDIVYSKVTSLNKDELINDIKNSIIRMYGDVV